MRSKFLSKLDISFVRQLLDSPIIPFLAPLYPLQLRFHSLPLLRGQIRIVPRLHFLPWQRKYILPGPTPARDNAQVNDRRHRPPDLGDRSFALASDMAARLSSRRFDASSRRAFSRRTRNHVFLAVASVTRPPDTFVSPIAVTSRQICFQFSRPPLAACTTSSWCSNIHQNKEDRFDGFAIVSRILRVSSIRLTQASIRLPGSSRIFRPRANAAIAPHFFSIAQALC
jgi:hypothetical protein